MTRQLLAVTTALALTLALAGCGDDTPAPETHTASNGDKYNDADLEFATSMIRHHAQALSMVDLTLDRRMDPPVQELVEAIRATQAPEIEQMVDWLTAWGEEIPETMRDHANAHGDNGDSETHGDEMPGMLSAGELSALEQAPDAEFQGLFLEMMIEHHEGAIAMARTEQDEGVFAPAVELANSIESSQADEVARMEELLAS